MTTASVAAAPPGSMPWPTAPVASAINQATQLAGDVFGAALAISNFGQQDPVILSVPQWAGRGAESVSPGQDGAG